VKQTIDTVEVRRNQADQEKIKRIIKEIKSETKEIMRNRLRNLTVSSVTVNNRKILREPTKTK
jgi:hypothetical protein